MKQVLSLLLSFVVLQTQTWALSGGPFGGDNFKTIIGTYSGVLTPVLPEDGATTTNTSLTANSLGLFIFGAPAVGVATGSIAFFTNGEVFAGDLVGVGDPESGDFQALIDANTTLQAGSVTTGNTTTTVALVGQALGKMEARVASGEPGAVQRIKGTAHLDLFLGQFAADGSVAIAESFDFIVEGFQQTGDPTASTDTSLGSF